MISYHTFHDHLTGLYNRAFFEVELKRLNSERMLPLSLILCDANGLKLVNDAFGHDEGDRILKNSRHTTQCMQKGGHHSQNRRG